MIVEHNPDKMNNESLVKEVKYLRWLVWLLSRPGLIEQHDKYKMIVTRAYVESENDLGLHSKQFK